MSDKIEVTKLETELKEAKKIIAEFVWPCEATEKQYREFLVQAAKFAGVAVPVFTDQEEQEHKDE